MAILIQASGDAFSAMVHGREDEKGRRFLERQWERASSVVGEGSKRFMERARKAFDSFSVESVDRSVRAIKRRLDGRWQENDVRVLRTIGEQQQAPLRMQRWLMSNERYRRLVHKDRAHGWRDTYVDMEPGSFGERHTDYKKVHNGLAVTNEDGNTSFVTYFDAFDDEGNEELTHRDQLDILESHDWTNHYLALGGDDPGSPGNGSL